jgi:hypothetical protein
MPITGQVNDLSLGELVELFCNKRKTGRLTVTYPEGVAYFYLKPGMITHATFGNLSGTAAVDYALSLPNGSFTFSADVEAEEKSIDRAWAPVVLEGLRRIDEGIMPPNPFAVAEKIESEGTKIDLMSDESPRDRSDINTPTFGFLSSQYGKGSVFATNRWSSRTLIAVVVLMMAIIGVPWGWYTHTQAVKMANQQQAVRTNANVAPTASPESSPAQIGKRASDDNAKTK